MSASEMLLFVRCFRGMVASKIPESCQEWHLYLLLIQIIDIVTSPCVEIECGILLTTLVEEHHTLYIKLFQNLKPKHHHIIHYSRVLKEMDPLVNLWAIRFESKHNQLKRICNNIKSRVNLPKSIAIKHQHFACEKYLQSHCFIEKNSDGPGNHCLLETLSVYSLLEEKPNGKLLGLSCTWTVRNGINFKIGGLLILPGLSENEFPKFVQICYLFVTTTDLIFLCRVMETYYFDEHALSYTVSFTSKFQAVFYRNLSHFPNLHLFYIINNCMIAVN